jgi:hypothetical protein
MRGTVAPATRATADHATKDTAAHGTSPMAGLHMMVMEEPVIGAMADQHMTATEAPATKVMEGLATKATGGMPQSALPYATSAKSSESIDRQVQTTLK